jgi:saccharopine dehydrogenase-like NADP-dependent oxidoreductase
MKKVLILGAGKSSTSLIDYMLAHAHEKDWMIYVADVNLQAAEEKVNGHVKGKAIFFDVQDDQLRRNVIAESDLVLSLMPAHLHSNVAADCVQMRKHFVCASYVSDVMLALHKEAQQQNVMLLNEMGLDPGIDHMSAMKMIDDIREKGGNITAFESYTGGLIAPQYDTNPWNYKFTWNPRNVVLAGQGTAKFLQHGALKYIPYQKLFSRFDILEVPGYGQFEGYPNRDSLKYRDAYKLQNVQTLVRGTLRKKGFCEAWDVFVQLGMTDDSYQMENLSAYSWNDFITAFLPASTLPAKENLKLYLQISEPTILEKLEWLGIFSDEKLKHDTGTPARVLQTLLEEKWKLEDNDKDMCVMLHVMEYELSGKLYRMQSSMVALGEDAHRTAMAKTVGLPMGIAAKMILQGNFAMRGVCVPVYKEIYSPVLKELETQHDIRFTDVETLLH